MLGGCAYDCIISLINTVHSFAGGTYHVYIGPDHGNQMPVHDFMPAAGSDPNPSYDFDEVENIYLYAYDRPQCCSFEP